VRKHPIAASATLALLIVVVAACEQDAPPATGASSPANTCVNASAPHHAYVVVQHLSTSTAPLQRCVGFSGDTIDGQTLMDRSGVEYQAQTFSFGKAVCQVDGEPRQYSKCFADNGPNWALFVATGATGATGGTGGTWAAAQTGYTQVTLHDKDALGWVYTANASPAPPPLPKER
jgi:hypothetical protein